MHDLVSSWVIPCDELYPFELYQKDRAGTSVGKGVENLELWCIVDGNVKWCSHYGKLYDGSSKN